MKIFLATWLLEVGQGNRLTTVGSKRRLLSFYHTKEKESELEQYARTGKNENISSGWDDSIISRRKRERASK